MRRKGRPSKQKATKSPAKRGRPRKRKLEDSPAATPLKVKLPKKEKERIVEMVEESTSKKEKNIIATVLVLDDGMSEGLHMTTSQVNALGCLVACRECGEAVKIGVRPTTKGMISEFTVSCTLCDDHKSTNTPNLVRERKRKRNRGDRMLQKTENINYAHVAAFLDNGLGYSGLRHYCRYFNARCLNEATFIVYARQVINDVINDTEESLLYAASIVREVFKSQLETDDLIDLTVAYTTTYHQWGSDFCLVAGAVIELTTGLVVDYDVANMYCHVCKINAKKIVSMSPSEMTEWFNKHQDTCEIREWCDELDHDADEGVKEIEPKYLECFVAKKIWMRSAEKYGFRYTTLIHESDERIVEELVKSAVYDDIPIMIDSATSCFSRRKSEHARTSFQTKLKAKCPRERVQTKDRILYVYAMSIPEYNKFAISSNIKLRHLVKEMQAAGDPLIVDMGLNAEIVEKGEDGGGGEVASQMEVVEENGEEDEEVGEVEEEEGEEEIAEEGEVEEEIGEGEEEGGEEEVVEEVGEEEEMEEIGEVKQEKVVEKVEEKAKGKLVEMKKEERPNKDKSEKVEEVKQQQSVGKTEQAQSAKETKTADVVSKSPKTVELASKAPKPTVDSTDNEELEESTEAVVRYLQNTDPACKAKEKQPPRTEEPQK